METIKKARPRNFDLDDRYLSKAKRTDNGQWVIGLLTVMCGQLHIISTDDENTAYPIDKETICQCTGLKDKNDELIWENDVIKDFSSDGSDWSMSKVVFGEHSLNLGWCIEGLRTLCKYNVRLFNVGLDCYNASKCEVIGNIFDNPELNYGKDDKDEVEIE